MRLYTTPISAVAVTVAQDIFEVLAPSDAVVIIHGWTLTQTSDAGDAEEEVLRVETVRGIGAVASGSGGSSVTPRQIELGEASYGGTVETNNTTRMATGSGTLDPLEMYGWNIRIPWTHFYTPELRPVISPGDRWTLSLLDAPADAITLSAQLWLQELGG